MASYQELYEAFLDARNHQDDLDKKHAAATEKRMEAETALCLALGLQSVLCHCLIGERSAKMMVSQDSGTIVETRLLPGSNSPSSKKP